MKNTRLYHWHASSSKPDYDGTAEIGGYLPWGYAQMMLIRHIHELSGRFPKSAKNCDTLSTQVAIATPGARTWELHLVEADATVTFTITEKDAEKQLASKPAPAPASPAVRPRIGDADRQKVLDKLEQAYSGGYLTQEEWSERADRVLSARYADDLLPITADLSQVKEEKEESIVPAMKAGQLDTRKKDMKSIVIAALFTAIGLIIVFLNIVNIPHASSDVPSTMLPFVCIVVSILWARRGMRGK